VARQPYDLVLIAVIVSPHGVRGQVKIKHYLDNPKSILSKSDIFTKDQKKRYKLSLHSISEDILIASIAGITDREAAEQLRNTELYIPRDALPTAPNNSWYYSDLIGLSAQLMDGNIYGEIHAVHNFGAGDILEIKRTSGEMEMLPFNENFIGTVDVACGFVIVIPPQYIGGEQQSE
jgi:16S rRNA processing protein RimM